MLPQEFMVFAIVIAFITCIGPDLYSLSNILFYQVREFMTIIGRTWGYLKASDESSICIEAHVGLEAVEIFRLLMLLPILIFYHLLPFCTPAGIRVSGTFAFLLARAI